MQLNPIIDGFTHSTWLKNWLKLYCWILSVVMTIDEDRVTY